MKQLGLTHIGTTLGDESRENIVKYPGTVDLNFLEKTVGVLKTLHKRADQTATDLCRRSFAELISEYPLDPGAVDILVVTSQHTRANIPPLSAIVAGKLGLREEAYCLDLSIGCTGFVQGLHVIKTLMQEQNFQRGLLFNVETLSEVLAPDDANTNYLFSDAATCTLVSAENVFALPEHFNFGTSGARCLALNALGRRLQMDGLELYKYVTSAVPRGIQTLLANHGRKPADLDFIFFHQASARTVNKLKEGFPEIRAPFEIFSYGNTASCSIPFLLKAHREEILAGPKGRILLSSFGSGLSFANCIMRTPR